MSDALADELDLITYAAAREAGESAGAIAAYFGARVPRLEAEYQQRNALLKPST